MAAGSNNIVTDGLIACWDAGNRRSYPGAGTVLTDLAGGQNGTMENMDTGGFDSQKGGVIEFDGTDEYVDMGSSNQILPGGRNPFTISLWLKPDSQGDSNSEGLYSFYQPDDDQEGSTTYAFGIFWEPNASAETYAFYAGQRGLTTWGPPKTSGASREDWVDTWCCITITYNGEGTKSGHANYRFYINDVNYALSDIGGPWGGTVNFNRLGNATASPTHAYTGDMANISIYNRALSADEVSQNYEALKPRFEPRIPKEGLMYYVDAGDPLCYDGNLANYYAPGTYNLRDLAEGAIGEFNGMNSQYPFFVNANGGYWELDGTDDKICPFSGGSGTPYSRYTSANGITGIMWINLAEDSTNIFFWKDDTFQFRYDNSNKLNMRSGNGTSWSTSADLKSAADLLAADGTEWACVAALANKSNDAREIWLNGERVANDTGSGMVWGTNNNIMGVGSESLGDVAMALLYERALSAAEIKDFYNKTKARFGH